MSNKTRFTTEELSMIKSTFAENEEILRTIRKVFLQMPLNEKDESYLSMFKGNSELIGVMRKTFLPELTGDAPLNQNIDLWLTINVIDKKPDDAEVIMESRELLISYLDESLRALNGEDSEDDRIIFTDLTPRIIKESDSYDRGARFARLITRNTIVQHTEQCLQQLELLAGKKEETPEETLERLNKNSSK